MEEGSREGEIILHGGILHCPGGHRTWTVSWFDGELKFFCTSCKRVFEVYVYDLGEFKNVSAGVE